MDGIAEWNGLRNRSGNNFVNFVDMTDVVDFTPGPGTVIVNQRSINANGQAGCAGGELYLRLQRFLVVNDIGRVPTVAAHEAGHLLELDHTGLDDNYDWISSQAPPIMATCLASGATDTRAIGNDDAGHMTDRHDSTASSDRVTANPSFENQLDYWEEYSAGGAAVHTSLGVTDSLVGSFHMRFRHDVGGSRVQSVTRVANAGGRTFDARASFKRMNSSHTGRVTLTVVYQNVDYGPGSGTNCSYVGNVDMNDVTEAGWWGTIGSATATITVDSWYYVSINPVTSSTAHDAIDVGLLLYSSMNNCNNEYVNACRVNVKADDVYAWHS